MKNVHVLPTDKPSRLVKQKYDTIDRLCLADIATKRAEYKRLNIYITSDEYIGISYYLDGSLVRKGVVDDKDYWEVRKDYKKIILTTDQDLIADGVQAINDEFLEWFIKNPSYGEVKLDSICKCISCGSSVKSSCDYAYKCNPQIFYKIIIPKEEQTKCYCGHTTYCDCGPLEEPKQETLEEAAKKYANKVWDYSDSNEKTLHTNCNKAFLKGAKWQQEKSYSEEEVLEILKLRLKWFRILPDEFEDNKWFEQFKKK